MADIEYKKTLNLPKTKFPMKANLAQREPKMLEFWQKMDLYGLMQKQRQGAEKFILNDGPPYANGDIHIGHALNKILKDIIVKSKHLSGYKTSYVPGWDCHGLPIELQVEKKIGKPGQKVDAATFRSKCREYANKQIDIQRKSFMRLGVVGDWFAPYITMDYVFEANIIRTLGKIITKGHLVTGDRPVHWCVDCGSALAEAEVEYKDKTSSAIDVFFPAKDQNKLAKIFNLNPDDQNKNNNINIVIWTTTPWTLPANQAVAVNAKFEYMLVKTDSKLFVVAKLLLESCLERFEITDYEILGECLGKDLELQLLKHPFYDRTVPIILGDHVTLDAGTGCVHTAPAHGADDYLVSKKYDLAIDNPVGSNGCFFANILYLEGMHIYKANKKIIEILENNNNLLCHKPLLHSYPHCWRHKAPLIFRATKQWFVSMEKNNLRKMALAEIEKVNWLPDWGQARITAMVSGRPDWCISRQRTWGTPMCLFVHKETGEMHPNTAELIEKTAKLVEKNGINAWYDLKIEDFLNGDDISNYEKISDTLDVWFDSGAVHACVLDVHKDLHSPADLYLEGSDQYRGWFQTSLLSSVAVKNTAPYKQVLTHGFTVDADGRKMSKSLGNVISPEKLLKTLGADIIRLWVASTNYRDEIHVSDEILKRTSDAYRRIRNTARFLLANLDEFDPGCNMLNFNKMLLLDQWIVVRAAALQETILKAYESYQFHVVYQEILNFCINELGSFHLDIIKDRQYTCGQDSRPRRSAQTALYYIVKAFVRWIAPIMSFTAEEIWQHLPADPTRAQSVFLGEWEADLPSLSDNISMNDYWQEILNIRTAVNKELENARKAGVLGSALEAEVDLYCNEKVLNLLGSLKDELRFVLITSQARVHNMVDKPEGAVDTDISGLSLVIKSSQYAKCERCWHRREDVNNNLEYPNICSRCVKNLSTSGEERVFA